MLSHSGQPDTDLFPDTDYLNPLGECNLANNAAIKLIFWTTAHITSLFTAGDLQQI